MTREDLNIYFNPKRTAESFGDYLMMQAEDKEAFHCALSGGSTPKLLFDYLAQQYKFSPLWNKIHFYWGDERCVDPDDNESNYKMTKERLLSKVKIPEANIHRVYGENDPDGEAIRYGEELMDCVPVIGNKPVFDLIILGMGEDGHTASIFPHEVELLESENICEVATHPTSGQQRITLTGPVINTAHEVAFLVTGAGKKEKIAEIFRQTGDWQSYPAAHINPELGILQWFVDEAAASGLK